MKELIINETNIEYYFWYREIISTALNQYIWNTIEPINQDELDKIVHDFTHYYAFDKTFNNLDHNEAIDLYSKLKDTKLDELRKKKKSEKDS
ncbi:MAG: hypothetical protein MJ245_03010 [Clostridia bacterium]|nr:hypothetical protein [Clostridia bacterium]